MAVLKRTRDAVGIMVLGSVLGCSSSNDNGGPHPASDAGTPRDASTTPPSEASPEKDAAPPKDAEKDGTVTAPAHGPVKGLVSVGTAEYTTGLLMSDGTVRME